MILPMGAEHTTHEKLITIVKQIEADGKSGLFNLNSISKSSFEMVNGLYRVPNYADCLIYPRYENIGYVDEEKIDGFSYTCDNGEFYSRKLSEAKGNEGQPICKSGHLPHLTQILRKCKSACSFNIHGELFKIGGTSDDVTRIMGCTEDKAIIRQLEDGDKLRYMVHDIMEFDGHNMTSEPWFIRRAVLEYWFDINQLYNNKYVLLSKIDHTPIESFHRIVSSGGEGLMIKNTHGIYIPGKKPANNWIKCKKEITADVIITGFNDGTGKNASLFGSIQFGMYVNGELKDMGNVSSGLTDEIRNKIADDMDKYVGSVIEITAMQGSGNSFRHPRFKRLRIDKNPLECVWNNVHVEADLI